MKGTIKEMVRRKYGKMHKIDVHIHTADTSSCARVRAIEVVNLYKKAGYFGIVITDHYHKGFFNKLFETSAEKSWEEAAIAYLSGYLKAVEEGKRIGLKVFLGMEITFNEGSGDYLVFGIDMDFLKTHPKLHELNLKMLRDLTKDRNILIYQAHPFRSGLNSPNAELLDGLEVYNGNPRHDSRNELAYQYAQENGLKMISGSDFHRLEDLARGGIILNERIGSEKELVEILREKENLELIRL